MAMSREHWLKENVEEMAASYDFQSRQVLGDDPDVVTLNDGPDDTVISVLSWLDVAEIGRAAGVSRRWAHFAGSDVLWHPLYVHRFGSVKRGSGSGSVGHAATHGPSRPAERNPHPSRETRSQALRAPTTTGGFDPLATLQSISTTRTVDKNITFIRAGLSSSSEDVSCGGGAQSFGSEGERDERKGETGVAVGLGKILSLNDCVRSVRYAFRSRLACPLPGDHVQAAWRGKFRLDASLVFVGVSWWDAKVVAVEYHSGFASHDVNPKKNTSASGAVYHGGAGGGTSVPVISSAVGSGVGGQVTSGRGESSNVKRRKGPRRAVRYRVHYRSWSRRWDEWIEPSMLRWKSKAWTTARRIPCQCPVDAAARSDMQTFRMEKEFSVDQPVELYCHGDAAGGAWLDARVRKVSHDSVCLSDMSLSSQLLWVSRDRIRPKPDAPASIAAIVLNAFGPGSVDEAVEAVTRNERRSGLSRAIVFARRRRLPRRMAAVHVTAASSGGGASYRNPVVSGEGTCCVM